MSSWTDTVGLLGSALSIRRVMVGPDMLWLGDPSMAWTDIAFSLNYICCKGHLAAIRALTAADQRRNPIIHSPLSPSSITLALVSFPLFETDIRSVFKSDRIECLKVWLRDSCVSTRFYYLTFLWLLCCIYWPQLTGSCEAECGVEGDLVCCSFTLFQCGVRPKCCLGLFDCSEFCD